jgi:hypothetical protein
MTTAAKETEAPERETALDRLAGRLRDALRRESESVVEIGNILIECREHVPHGEWLAWLAENFRLSYRTARRYECAAEYVAGKSDTVADFGNLSPTVLYNLAEGWGDEDEEAAILAATREGFVDEDAALAICEKLALPDAGDGDDAGDDDDDDAGDGDDAGAGDDAGDDAGDGNDAGNGDEDPEIKAILDGLPPVLPPAPDPQPPDFAVQDFDRAIGTLNRVRTKMLAQFANTSHSVDVLKGVADFINAVVAEADQTVGGRVVDVYTDL